LVESRIHRNDDAVVGTEVGRRPHGRHDAPASLVLSAHSYAQSLTSDALTGKTERIRFGAPFSRATPEPLRKGATVWTDVATQATGEMLYKLLV